MVNKLLLRREPGLAQSDDVNFLTVPPPSISNQWLSTSAFPDMPSICEYIEHDIFPKLAPPPYGKIEVKSLSDRKPVFLFHEGSQNISAVGKIFKYGSLTLEESWLNAEKEFFNLHLLRTRFGMDNHNAHVVTPLGKNKELDALLALEKAPGQVLDFYVARAIYEQKPAQLYERLTALAGFFVKLHLNTENTRTVSPQLPWTYFNKLMDSLNHWKVNRGEREGIEKYAAKYWDRDDIFTTDREVIVHGDATTTNFLFTQNEVTAIDLEKMKWADRCWDLGFIAAELKHHFMWRTGDRWASEPFIGHFLWQYAFNYNKDEDFFCSITRKIPLYMALGLLRISRNTWLDLAHRNNLVSEAKRCLKYGLLSSTTTTH